MADPVEHAWTVQPLEWDTSFFGARMGQLRVESGEFEPGDLARGLRRTICEAFVSEAYAHLILRCASEESSRIWAAGLAGMRLVDVGLDLECTAWTGNIPHGAPTIRRWEAADLPSLQMIAQRSFVFSRFAVDPFFTIEQAEAFHAAWVTNLCQGLAQEVLVAGPAGEPLGFVSCALSGGQGRIPLIAVSSNARRLGIGAQLVDAANRWFQEAGVSNVWVKTQAHNYPALRLYQGFGFSIGRCELTFTISSREVDH